METAARYFAEVVKQGSIRGASETLHVAASAIGRQIKLLEEEYDATFLQRSVRGIELTRAGEAFLQYTKGIDAERTKLLETLDDLKLLKRGHIGIATIDGIVGGPLSDAISTFRRENNAITFDVRSMGAEAVVEAVQNGDSEIGIAYFAPNSSGVRIAHSIPDPLCAIVGTEHPWATRGSISLEELISVALAVPDSSFGIRKLIDTICTVRKLNYTIALETNSIEALRGFARSGTGAALLPPQSSLRDVVLGAVRSVQIDVPESRQSTIDIFVHENRALSNASAAFLKVLTRKM